MGFGSTAPVKSDGAGLLYFNDGVNGDRRLIHQSGTAAAVLMEGPNGAGSVMDYKSGLHADLATASLVTINDLRQSIQLQRLLERDARGGTRYVELLKSHWALCRPTSGCSVPSTWAVRRILSM